MSTGAVPHVETVRPPLSWWLGVLAFAGTCGWIVLVVTSPAVAVAVAVVVGTVAGVLLARVGVLRLQVTDRLHAGRARLEREHVGLVTVLDSAAYRAAMGRSADARAFIVTRPWLDRGVTVVVDDPADPTPYWLVGSRDPARLAAALEQMRQTGATSGPAPDRPDDTV